MRDRKSIQLLSDPLIDQIAAGEVIERPASVVKELIENALDGGATKIELIVENGGLDLIQVVDNGFGINQADLPLSVVAHATSKITTADDLTKIMTRGFRGEALSTMGAVGELEVASRAQDASEAFAIEVRAGQSSILKPVALTQGTRVSLRHLFRQIPARRKFLKSARAESNRCLEVFTKMAMTQPKVHFVYKVDGKIKADWPLVNDIKKRVAKILKVADLREGNSSRPGIDVKVYVAAPEHAKQTRSHQYLFLMGRVIKDRAISQVIWQSSREFVPDNRHPMLMAEIEMDPSKVDVNVHPNKEEVRFEEPRRVAALIGEAIRDAMAQAVYAAEMNLESLSENNILSPQNIVREKEETTSFKTASKLPRAQRPIVENWSAPDRLGWQEKEIPEDRPIRQFMQLHDAYIVFETDEGLSILDQHALHERILLQRFRKQMLSGEIEQQVLLIPHLIEMNPTELAILIDLSVDLKKIGFEFEDHGDGVLAVSALPVALKANSVEGALMDIIDRSDGLSDTESLRLAIARICACKSAVKAGDSLSKHEIEALLKDHEKEDFSFACEHGRPTHVKITLSQLSRGFERH
jgi:DNA mismatch repair protein MutL